MSLNCIIQKYTGLRHPSALVLKKGMLTYITYRCLWIASSKVCWLKSPTQLVSLNCIIQKYTDLRHPSALVLKKKSMLTYITHLGACSWFEKKGMLTYTTHRCPLNCFIQSKLTLITWTQLVLWIVSFKSMLTYITHLVACSWFKKSMLTYITIELSCCRCYKVCWLNLPILWAITRCVDEDF